MDVARELGVILFLVFFCANREFTGSHRLSDGTDDVRRHHNALHPLSRCFCGQPIRRLRVFGATFQQQPQISLGLDPALVEDGRSIVTWREARRAGWREDIVMRFHGHHFRCNNECYVPRSSSSSSLESISELYDLKLIRRDEQCLQCPSDDIRRERTLYLQLRERRAAPSQSGWRP